jgi:hypothetical protein
VTEGEPDARDGTRGTDRSIVGRRQLLRTGANVGLCGVLVAGIGANYVTPDDLGVITYAMARPEPDSPDLEPRRKAVPVDWHEEIRTAFAVQQRIGELELSPLLDSFVVPGTFDEPQASLSVSATDAGIEERLESLADPTPIDVEVLDELPAAPEAAAESPEPYQLAEFDPEEIPGGVVCENGDGVATLASALFEADGDSRFFATSNHLYGDLGTRETDHRGEPLSVLSDDEAYHVGDVERGYPAADVVTVTPREGYRPSAAIERASPSRVIGQYTKVGLAELAARGEPLSKLGAMTDETSGGIEGVDGVTCFTGAVCRPGQFRWGDEEAFTDGDSGSIAFHADEDHPDDYLLVAGICNARTWWPGADFVWGTAGYHLLDEYGLHF